jgi:hypothetical protein
MDIAQQFIWRKKLEEYDKNSNCTYFEKQFDQMFPLYVHFSTNDMIVCACD